MRAEIDSIHGVRFVHDTLEEFGWEVLVADAQKVKGLAPRVCRTDMVDARVLAELSWRRCDLGRSGCLTRRSSRARVPRY